MPAEHEPEDGLISPEACEGCGETVETAVGMDSIVTVTDSDTAEREEWVFCDWSCFDDWYQSGRMMGMIPGAEPEKGETA